MAIGKIGVHAIFKDLIDPDKELQRAVAVEMIIAEGVDPEQLAEEERRWALQSDSSGSGGGGEDGSEAAPAEGSPRAAEGTAAEPELSPMMHGGTQFAAAPRAEQQVGVKTRSCTIL